MFWIGGRLWEVVAYDRSSHMNNVLLHLSASSRTIISIVCRLNDGVLCRWSTSLPGVAITISGPLRSAASWLLISRPPTKWYKIRLEKNHLTSHLIVIRGGSTGRVQGARTPPPPEMICGFLTQLVFCKKKNYVVYWCWSRLSKRRVHPLLKKNPGSAPGNEWNKRNYFGKKNGKKECLLYISSFFTCSPY